MKHYKMSVWLIPSGEELLWFTYHFQCEDMLLALKVASDYIDLRYSDENYSRVEVKEVKSIDGDRTK